jgi:LuxR family maltose regulon positive regulatory protein
VAVHGQDDVAWVTVQPGEDTRVFWRTFAAALAEVIADTLRARLTAAAQDSLRAVEEAPAQLARVIRSNPRPILVVFDNLHEISGDGIHSGLLQLLSQTSGSLRAIVLTRHDPPWPLHRMQLEGMLAELRAADLAFDADETAELFAQMSVFVTTDQLTLLLNRTEGWAAGLRLAALGVSSAPDPARFIGEFSGDEHIVADYLMREVWFKQPPDWRDFLLKISIVEEICGDLANALTGGDDGAERLVGLAEANLFVHALGRVGHWYRLHQLLVDFLHGRLTDPGLRRDLHRRAAEWFRSRDMTWPAIRHAVAGGQWDLAEDLVSVNVAPMVAQQSPGNLEILLASLPSEVLHAHPGLAMGLAAARVMRGDLTDLDQLTQTVRDHMPRLSDERRREYQIILDIFEIMRFRRNGDLGGALEACRRIPIDAPTLSSLGLRSWDVIRTVVLSNLGTGELWTGDLARAREHLILASQTGPPAGLHIPRLNAQAHLALLEWTHGDLNQAFETAQRTVTEFSRAGMPFVPQSVCAYLALAGTAIDRDEIDTARRWLDLAQHAEIESHIILAVATMRARLDAADGRVDEAIATIRAARERALYSPVPQPVFDRAVLTEADLLRRAGASVEAEHIAGWITDTGGWDAIRYRVRAALDERTVPLDSMDSWSTPMSLRMTVELNVLRARYAAFADNQDEAQHSLERALIAAAPQLLRSPFIQDSPAILPLLVARLERGTQVTEFAIDLINRIKGARTSGMHPEFLVVPLTERESIMLGYLASTLSNAEIADALFVSGNTVKSHQRMIYRKLAVTGRRAAVARGRELGLL